MTIDGFLRNSVRVLVLSAVALNTQGASTSIATAPLVTSSDTAVHPNVMFVLDDSGSMDWAYLPDWAQGAAAPLFTNSRYNGLAYNPAILYRPPIYYTAAGVLDTSTYPGMTGSAAANGANTASGLPNWKAVKQDGYGIQSTSTTDLTSSASFYTFIAGEYCATPGVRTCVAATAPSVSYPEPAYLRWCKDTALTNCQAVWISGSFNKPRYPGLVITPWGSATGKVTVSTAVNPMTISSIKVNGVETMSSAVTTTSTTTSSVCTSIKNKITANGFTASCTGGSSNIVTITAPATLGNITFTPAPTNSAGTLTPAAFSGGVNQVAVPGSNVQTTIVSTTTSYAYPGTTTKAPARSDCTSADGTCTYAEEMINYANWWAYFHTRMQMMKTAASGAFQTIGDTYRVGMFTISAGSTVKTGTNFLNASEFAFPQKKDWYDKLFASNPASYTPLRGALAKAGKYFANKLTGQVDPMQFSCQQNFTILSTDGYWNTNNETSTYGPYKLDGTNVGNQDGLEPRPYSDGATVTYTQSTSQIQKTQSQPLQSTSQVQSETTRIQQRTTQVQKSTASTTKLTGQLYTQSRPNSTSSFTDWSAVSTCSEDSSGGSRRNCSVGTLQTQTSSNSGGTWSAWSNVSSCTYDGSGSSRTNCQISQNWQPAASCTPTRTGSSGSYSWTGGASAVDCSSSASWGNVATCVAPDTCQTADTGWVNASSCTPSGPTGGQTIICQTPDTGWVTATGGVCTASSSGGQTVTCNTATTGPTAVASCTAVLASASNNYTRTTCGTNTISASAPVASCTPVTASASNSFTATTCNTTTTGPSTVSSCLQEAASSLNNWTTTTCSAVIASGGISNTLADVAEYYYVTDLRSTALGNCTGSPAPTTGNTLCSTTSPDPYNNVPTSGLDGASWQHMTTFTLGLGASGYMQFSSTYLKDKSGDFFDVKNGTPANPTGGICSWQNAGTICNWTAPASDAQTNIDDLWHAAVNGRGTYFSATDPSTLSAGLSTALSGVSARLGASAAATTSNPNITSGDNFVFSSTFTTNDWDGQLVRQQLDLTTGITSAIIDWSARDQLDTNASRTIYTFSSAAANKLKDFTWTGLGTDQSNFTTPHISTSPPTGMTGLTQFCASGCLSSASQTDAQGQKLVDFLKGDSSNEDTATDTSKYYRKRSHRLGDIANAEAVYVKASLFTYADDGYMGTGGFAEANNSRVGMVYAAANDGMLHAFYANTDSAHGAVGGAEAWAYVPALVLPNLYKLADKDYSNQHTYYLDGTPVAGDICPTAPTTKCTGSQWKTILVGGLNRGGRGYYALDVTDPAAPKALWEFTDTNMGFTFGNPEITKLEDGTWVVLVTSGYNNIASASWVGAGDGVGRLYVLNATTGVLIGTAISTGVGDTTTPSGLARIRAYTNDAMVDNTALRVYGGDLLGNVWRFDINGDVGAAGKDAQRLVTLYGDTSGTVPQPITAKPEVGDCNGKKMVFVGTGRYLGQTDIDVVPGQQSFYGIKDNLDTTTYTNPQASASGFIQQILTNTTCPVGASSSICTTGQSVRTSSNKTVNLASDKGWYLNFPDPGERDNTDPTLGLATLGFNTNVPTTSSCEIGGYSYRYFLNYCTGAPVGSVGTSSVVSVKLGNALATRPVFVRLPSNAIVELTRLSDGTTLTSDVPIGPGIAPTRRVSWRELTND